MAGQPSKYHPHNQWNYNRRSRLQEQSEPSLMFLVRFSHIFNRIKVIISHEIFYDFGYLENIFMFEELAFVQFQ